MDADDHPVEVVLKEARRFMVPLYQRKYQWRDRLLESFWDDVSAKAVEILDGESKFEHYMGALILSPVEEGSQIARTPRVQVVDGQQRLTTFQIFLAGLREVARNHQLEDLMEHIDGYLFNKPKSKDKDPLTRFKLTPTPSDRDIFHDIIEMPYKKVTDKHNNLFHHRRVPKNTHFPAFRAYYLLYSWIKRFTLNGPEENSELNLEGEIRVDNDDDVELQLLEERLEALLKAVLDRLKLVVITLDENDDAQVIFETLNSKGEPLLAMDLVRNNIFHRAEKQAASVEDLYARLWDPLDDIWWRAPAPNARPRRPRLDHFLAHVLAAETGKKISVRELYAEYRAFAVPKGKPRFDDVEDELKLIERYAPLYETLEGRAEVDPALYWLGQKLTEWQVTTVFPVALQTGCSDLPTEQKLYLARLIYSFLARRAICGLTTKNLNNVFQSIAELFLRERPSVEAFRAFFRDRHGDSTRFPRNDEFRQGILNGNAYSIAPRRRLVDILWELEIASRSHMAENTTKPYNLWVEHVLPQNWTEEWPFPDGHTHDVYADDPDTSNRRSLVHTLGNLTLLTSGLNRSSGNSKFSTKKEKFEEHTSLFLNKWFTKRDSWTETEILERSEHLFEKAVKIWIDLEVAQ
ncbi:MAG: DUF262 domain-containing protein [Aestuariivita sp.]|nr:DUF262 domain-containing protein [Aestuariivita sp.]